MTKQENAIKKTYHKRFAIPLDFDFFAHLVYPYGLKENLIVRVELNSSEKIILCIYLFILYLMLTIYNYYNKKIK